MSIFCIVCEFDPLHNGHKYLLGRARELGADKVVCVMSGNSTQRGGFSLIDKYKRAEAAVKCGADLVLELPFPWSSASADYFATAAVSIASGFCDTLLFGSECGNIEMLSRAAELCESEDFKEKYIKRNADGEGSASAYLGLLEEYGISGLSSNDILGIAYIRAIKRLDLDVTPVTVKREGADFKNTEITPDAYQSATAIRERIYADQSVDEYIPKPMSEILKKEKEAGRITDVSLMDSAILSFFCLSAPEELDGIADAGGGIANRLVSAARESVSFEEMFSKARTKRYTDAKLRRAVLYCMTGTGTEDVRSMPEYTTLLAANNAGRELLAENRKSERAIKVVTKPADAPDVRQTRLSSKLDALYGLARESKQRADSFVKKNAYID